MKIIKILILLIVCLSVANLFVTNKLVNYSDEIRSLSLEINELEKKNQNLRIKVAESSSITKISQRLYSLGYTDDPAIATIQVESNVALK